MRGLPPMVGIKMVNLKIIIIIMVGSNTEYAANYYSQVAAR